MITETGSEVTLNNVVLKFMSFLETTGAGVQSWEFLRQGSESFFGNTFAVPIRDYDIDESFTKSICIIPSTGVMFDRGTMLETMVMHRIEQVYYYSLRAVLQHIYPNADVYEYEYNGNHFGKRDLEQVYDSLIHVSDDKGSLPDIVICGGLDGSFDTFCMSDITVDIVWNDVKDLLDKIYNFCGDNNIKLCMVYAPDLMLDKLEHVGWVEYFIERYISPTDERIFNMVPIIWNTYMGNDLHISDDFLSAAYALFTYRQIDSHYYEMARYTKLKIRMILNEFFHINREEYYVSIQHQHITPNSYLHFYSDCYDNMSEEFNKIEAFTRTVQGKNGKEAFKNYGEMVAICLHTSFDFRLWMPDQGGVTMKRETDKQINDINLLPFWEFYGGAPTKRLDIPVYPGTGCPWLTISNRDKNRYGISSLNPIRYYFTKTNYNATITIRISDAHGVLPEAMQSISFGIAKNTYKQINPLYVAGGTEALSPEVWIYYPPSSHVNGLRYDLSMKNPALANGDLLHPTKFGKANMSNFRIMTPDGYWKDIYTIFQDYREYKYYHPCIDIKQWGVPITEPYKLQGYHTGAELIWSRDMLDTLTIYRNSEIYNKAYDLFKSKSPAYPIMVVLGADPVDVGNENGEEHTTLSILPDLYRYESRTMPVGLNRMNGRIYLVVPNGWEDRLWFYKWYVGRHYWEGTCERVDDYWRTHGWDVTPKGLEQNEYVRDEFHKLHMLENEYTIHDRLLIDFGKWYDKGSDIVVAYPDDYIPEDDKQTVFRLKLHLTGGVVRFSHNLTPNVRHQTIEFDYGDGTVKRLAYDTYDSNVDYYHIYNNITGDIYVNIKVLSVVYWPYMFKLATTDHYIFSVRAANGTPLTDVLECVYFNRNMSAPILMPSSTGGLIYKHKRLKTLYLYAHEDVCNEFTIDDCGIENLYYLGNEWNFVVLRIERTPVKNIYLSRVINKIRIIKLNDDVNIYCYSDKPILISGYGEESKWGDIPDKYGVTSIFHVKSSILSTMQQDYPMLTFIGDVV